ncbi:MAG: ABC transporter permease [Rhodanobacteraceae bacterium]|jgi:ABC-2 type transport system permease protein|nr:ABC transporter permease [Rhodanobacteraceae bacterium]
MNTIATRMPRAALVRCYALESRNEFLRLLRTPSFAVPTLLFPPLFYTLFALLLGSRSGNFHAQIYLLATYGVFGVMGPGLFGFGVTVALDRERGLLTLKRAQPMPPGAYLAAKLVMAMLFATLIFTILALLASAFGGVRLPAGAWLQLLVVDVLGVLPFCAIGLFVGSLVGGQGAPALINLIYLPMAFLSGLWMPLAMLPGFIATIAPLWPAWHLGRLALGVVGEAPGEAVLPHVLVLAGCTLVFLALARRRLARG